MLRRLEARIFSLVHLRPPATRLGRFVLRSGLLGALFLLLSRAPGHKDGWFTLFILVALVFFPASLWLFFRWVSRSLLWRLRNRLVANYLLIGLAPFVLLASLVLIMAYFFAGQFAIFATTGEMDRETSRLGSENRSYALHVAHELDKSDGKIRDVSLPELDKGPGDTSKRKAESQVAIFYDGKPLTVEGQPPPPELTSIPTWVKRSFIGLVWDKEKLYIRAIDTQAIHGHSATVLSSEVVDNRMLEKVASGLGSVHVIASKISVGKGEGTGKSSSSVNFNIGEPENHGLYSVKVNDRDLAKIENDAQILSGGTVRSPQTLYDVQVNFPTPLEITDWPTGESIEVPFSVSSRPTLLYERLFSSSLVVGNLIKIAIIALAVIFGMIELVALIMAAGLNRTITKSVADLYQGTQLVNRGVLSHQIVVKRNDQLAELSRSFNKMTESLQRLMQEHEERQRLLNDLAIAREVQDNLFPHANLQLPALELHGVCRPARTVSGDYYDFLLLGEAGLGLAIGDISGKGISAALLMATLHSAVRAYQFGTEDSTTTTVSGRGVSEDRIWSELFEEPGRILSLLNRHLFRSTQSEKYATLFLAHYDVASAQLRYSNGGQLPPFIVGRDAGVRRLDRGGMVVGLIDHQSYDEGLEQMNSGDILIAYSDGVTEPENDFGDFGEERLIDLVHRNRHQSLPLISEQVMLALTDWIGAQEQPDDITLVLARQK